MPLNTDDGGPLARPLSWMSRTDCLPRIRALLIGAGAALVASGAHAQLLGPDEPPRGQAVEQHLPGERVPTPWVRDPSAIGAELGDRFESREVAAEELETVKLTNVVPPILFATGVAEIPDATVAELREVLAGLDGRRNVRLHLVGHADTQPLSPRLAAVFGDNEGLSRERSGQVAEFLQDALALPPEAITYEWAGDTDPVASNETEAGRAQNRRVEVEVWYDEVEDAVAIEEILVEQEFRQIKVCRMETVCRLRYMEGLERRTRVQNLIEPLHFSADGIDVSPQFIAQIEMALGNMSDRTNVQVRFVGYTDDRPLPERDLRIYGDHEGLAKARARRVALAVQEALGLPNAAIDSDGHGAVRPLGPNETPQGQALNRRVEVEFWYDDPLQELPDEPQICPIPGTEIVTRVYDPPWGTIPTVAIVDGQPQIPAGMAALLQRGLADVAGRMQPRLRFVGYTENETLERRTAAVYGDDIGLSAARARRTMEAIGAELGLSEAQLEFEGRGYLHSSDVVNAGFVQGETSHVVVQVVYDEVAELDDYDGVDVTPLMRELTPENAFALNLMRITVDGEPIDDPGRSSSDVQRCTDVALQDAEIQFGFDTLEAERRLAVAAEPQTLTLTRAEDGTRPAVRFSMYANYAHFIDMAEVRVFEREQSTEAGPIGVIVIGPNGYADWQPAERLFTTPARELKYVLRAYGEGGLFDETAPQPLYLANGAAVAQYGDVGEINGSAGESSSGPGYVNTGLPGASDELLLASVGAQSLLEDVFSEMFGDAQSAAATESSGPIAIDSTAPAPNAQSSGEPSAAYGENALALSNIQLASGTVTVRGSGIPAGRDVYVAGNPVPVDPQGNFVAQEILPSGVHTVEVAVLDEEGNGELYLRDFEIEKSDWFYVGMADITLSNNDFSGPIELLQGQNPTFDYDSSADARLAFFANGKFGDGWHLTASADTRDGPLDDLFSNFLDKSPEALFRRIDPDYHYPTFGDDGIVADMAPTLGKFFVEAGRGDNYGRWGSFNVGYMNNELAQVDRGLYGANVHYQSTTTTSFGDQRFAIDGFTAEPGTIASWEEFRGTGGSLYFLRRQDILQGSERVRIEIRDRASGLVTGVVNLTPAIDYDVDYLQGRILLNTPLAATVGDDLLVRGDALSGDEAYLVVRYEYSPAFQELDALSVGGQAHYWFGDRVKLGLTANQNDEGAGDSSLGAADVTVRMSAESWLKLQGAETEGLITGAVRSDDGGFDFNGYNDLSFAGATAQGNRAEVSIGLGDIFERTEGRITVYGQELEGGYSAPGLQTLTEQSNNGGTFYMPITQRFSVNAKSDRRIIEQGLATDAREIDLHYALDTGWDMSLGVRRDERIDSSTDRAADPGAGRAHRRCRAGRLRVGRPLARVRLRAGHARSHGQPRGKRALRHGRLVSALRAAAVRRGALGRRSRPRRALRHELPADGAHDSLHELRARERAHGQRHGGDAGQRRQSRRRRQDAALGQLERLCRGTTAGRRLVVGPHALRGRESRSDRAAELKRQHRLRHPARHAHGRGDQSPGRRLQRRLRLRRLAVLERRRVPLRRDRAARSVVHDARDLALPQQLQVPDQPERAPARQAQPRRQRELARAVLRRRLHRGRARLRLSPRPTRPAQRARQVHLFLQRADDGSAHLAQRERRVPPAKPHRLVRPDLRHQRPLVDRRQVRAPHRRNEPRPRGPRVFREHGEPLRGARGLPVQGELGRARRRPGSRDAGYGRGAERHAHRDLALSEPAREDRGRLQLHRLLRRPDGPELRPPRCFPEHHGRDVARSFQGPIEFLRSIMACWLTRSVPSAAVSRSAISQITAEKMMATAMVAYERFAALRPA